jgi:hypothetical protein
MSAAFKADVSTAQFVKPDVGAQHEWGQNGGPFADRRAGLERSAPITVFAGDTSRTAIRHHRLDTLPFAYVGFLFRC